MPSLPTKGIKGQNFKAWAVDSINKLIDYLSSPYLTPGQGIAIRRTPSGTVIELQKQPEPVQQSVSGGTAGGMSFPDWGNLVAHSVTLSWSSSNPKSASYIVPASGWLKLIFSPAFNLNSAAGWSGHIILGVTSDGEQIYWYDKYLESLDNMKLYFDDGQSQLVPVKAGANLVFSYTADGGADSTPDLSVYLYY